MKYKERTRCGREGREKTMEERGKGKKRVEGGTDWKAKKREKGMIEKEKERKNEEKNKGKKLEKEQGTRRETGRREEGRM